MSERNQNERPVSKREKTRQLWVKIMAWVLSLLMAGSVATLTITMLLGR
ncbi:MAG: hypothetical protein MJ192_05290 [Clostridia bacterium]|nr:hypothetical protein [Clostridia bacterium]